MSDRTVSFDIHAVVKGYHAYRRKVAHDDECVCVHEPTNKFDQEAVVVLTQDGDIVRHVPASPVKMNSALLAIMQDGLDIKW